jgi:cytochrome b involved in lipid metabolism
MKNELLIGLAILVIGAGTFLFMNRPKEIPTTDTQQTPVSSQTEATTPTTITGITATEIAKHADKTSCWMAINGNVYDVTTYITSHPDGNSILLGCGKDATGLFDGTEAGGTQHSNKAQSMLSQYLIGSFVK